ncbi:hypothetical protein ACQFYA_03790 [Promicromonospora sp. Marseille-Q5078]
MRASRTRAPARRRGVMGPVPGAWRRRSTLAAAGAVALLTGLGAGFASGLGAGSDATAEGDGTVGPADPCTVVQAAWSRSATLQLGMSVDDPATLRRGFVGARDALAEVHPPAAVAEDWQTVGSYVGTVADEIEDADEADTASTVAETLADLDTSAMTQASNRITTFLKDGCGASDDGTDAESSDPPAG